VVVLRVGPAIVGWLRRCVPEASAVAVNPISILVPCHRVVRAGGVIGDYAGGADAKKFLIELERRHGH